MSQLEAEVNRMSQHLAAHPIYQHLNSLEAIECFMKYHVFAVFDFMSLLKSLLYNEPQRRQNHDYF